MALLARNATTLLSVDISSARIAGQVPGLSTSADIDPGDACCIKSDNTIAKANGTAADELARFAGIAPVIAKNGQALTLLGPPTVVGQYGGGAVANLVPGAVYFIAATAGRLDTAATTGGLTPVAKAINFTDIQIINLS